MDAYKKLKDRGLGLRFFFRILLKSIVCASILFSIVVIGFETLAKGIDLLLTLFVFSLIGSLSYYVAILITVYLEEDK